MFTPIPHSRIEDASGVTGRSRFLLVDTSEADTWFVARVIVGRDLSCNTMLFANAQTMLAVMDGPEHKKIVDLVLVIVRALRIESHRILRLWGTAAQLDLEVIAESSEGHHLACSTGRNVVPTPDLVAVLDIAA